MKPRVLALVLAAASLGVTSCGDDEPACLWGPARCCWPLPQGRVCQARAGDGAEECSVDDDCASIDSGFGCVAGRCEGAALPATLRQGVEGPPVVGRA